MTVKSFLEGGLPPWHMWGTTKVITLEATAPALAGGIWTSQTEQLVRIDYKRPENWRFFLIATVLAAPAGLRSVANFILQGGVGRSFYNLTSRPNIVGWNSFIFDTPSDGKQKWCTSIRTPLRNDLDATSFSESDLIVGDNINVGCNISTANANVGDVITLEVGAFMAPNVHIRPDWFLDQFDGTTEGH